MTEMKRCVAATLLLFVALGCSKVDETPTGTVKGTVTLGSDPLTSGQIEFFSSAIGMGSFALIQPDGSYELGSPLPVGEYSISVQGLVPEPGLPVPPPTKVPKKYWTAKTSGISQIVSQGPNTLDFTLSEK